MTRSLPQAVHFQDRRYTVLAREGDYLILARGGGKQRGLRRRVVVLGIRADDPRLAGAA